MLHSLEGAQYAGNIVNWFMRPDADEMRLYGISLLELTNIKFNDVGNDCIWDIVLCELPADKAGESNIDIGARQPSLHKSGMFRKE